MDGWEEENAQRRGRQWVRIRPRVGEDLKKRKKKTERYVAHCTTPEWTCLFGGCDTLTACSYTPRQPSEGTVFLAVQMWMCVYFPCYCSRWSTACACCQTKCWRVTFDNLSDFYFSSDVTDFWQTTCRLESIKYNSIFAVQSSSKYDTNSPSLDRIKTRERVQRWL